MSKSTVIGYFLFFAILLSVPNGHKELAFGVLLAWLMLSPREA